ncbi:ATP-binding protein [Actinoplanes sp. KI2]|uniref:HAMP domain-containing sensor histidine kinase n=1 Tax=Actinoplanes sp. KI2 TaxID=2983315 RepID=UPI0021D5C158|nr:ATP-binding protein [Actinoplanes sp. KI2]MCU7729311.1 ATP-binding protein [Actinoplanes sp. KI2]
MQWIDGTVASLPLGVLEVWGKLAYLVGILLVVVAYGGFTFRPGGHWRLGRERQAWDAKAVVSIPLTFILIVVSGYLGSFIVLVPEAQTFESLKDLAVFVCILLLGYPALITVPFAYGLSDLIEGVPPGFLLDWLPGYFINPACFWVAYLLIGRNPDFRRLRTWRRYLLFVAVFLAVEPMLWGHLTAEQFTPAISYQGVSSALFFTTSITWILAPVAMLAALPAARRFGLFWAEIPGHVRERVVGRKEWVWTSGTGTEDPATVATREVWPIRMVLLTPFMTLVLFMVGATSYVTLRSAEEDSDNLASRLHEEISDNIRLRLAGRPAGAEDDISGLLRSLPVARHGVALVVDRSGQVVGSSAAPGDPVAAKAVAELGRTPLDPDRFRAGLPYRFVQVTRKPLHRETWLARAIAYPDPQTGNDWLVLTVMPESYYQAGAQAGSSRTAVVFALALLLSLAMAAVLAAMLTARLQRLSLATRLLALGDLRQRVPGSRLAELDSLAGSFNDMAEQLQRSFKDLNDEVRLRKHAESAVRELNDDLEHKVAERTLELQIATAHAEAADRVKSTFLAQMSHELRTPLNAIIGFGEILYDRQVDPSSPQAQEFLGDILTSGRHLLQLVNDILDLSKIEAGGWVFRPESMDVSAVVGEVCGIVRTAAAEKHIRVEAEVEPGLDATLDPARFKQVLYNYVSNALKFTPERGRVVVRVRAEDPDRLRLEVEDTGVGIAPDDIARLFAEFVQLDPGKDRVLGGTGLGLALTQRLVEAQGGSVGVTSELGKGSLFFAVFPRHGPIDERTPHRTAREGETDAG